MCLQIAGLLASLLVLLVVVAIGFVFQPLPTVSEELSDMLSMELIDFVQQKKNSLMFWPFLESAKDSPNLLPKPSWQNISILSAKDQRSDGVY